MSATEARVMNELRRVGISETDAQGAAIAQMIRTVESETTAFERMQDALDVDVLTPWQIAKVVEVRSEDRWEQLVHSSWLTAHLSVVGWHVPKDFPKSPAELLKKADPKPKAPMTKRDWQAFIFGVTGNWKDFPDDPPDAEPAT